HGFPESFFNGWDIFLGNVSSLDLIDKLETYLAFLGRGHGKYDVRKLTTATGLFLVHLPVIGGSGQGFLVFHLGLSLVHLDLELASKAVHNDIQVKFAHPRNDGLSGSLIGLDLKSGVLFRKLGKGHAQFIDIDLGLGLHSDPDHRIWEIHALQNDRMLFIRKGIPGLDVLEANGGTYVTGLYIFNGILFVGMHLVDPGNPFLVPGTVVQYIGTGIQMS